MSKYAVGFMDQGLGHGHFRLVHADTMKPVTDVPQEDAFKLAAALEMYDSLKLYLFIEQSNAGRNPHPEGTNAYRAFELGLKAIAKAEGTNV